MHDHSAAPTLLAQADGVIEQARDRALRLGSSGRWSVSRRLAPAAFLSA